MGQVTKRHPASATYARALLEIAQAVGEGDAFADQLSGFASALETDRQLRLFFESPKIPAADKRAVLDRSLSGRASAPVLNLLKILIDKGRQELYVEISETFGEILDQERGRHHVSISSPKPISGDARQSLVSLLGQRFGGEIVATESVDSEMLGGMVVRVGDTVIDGSLRTKLKHVREAMSAPRLGRNLIG